MKQLTLVNSTADVERLVFQSLSDFCDGRIDAEVARTVGYLATVAAKVSEAASWERRVAELEEVVAAQLEKRSRYFG